MNVEKNKTKPGAIFHFIAKSMDDPPAQMRYAGGISFRKSIGLRTHRTDPQLHPEEGGRCGQNPGPISCAAWAKGRGYAVERGRYGSSTVATLSLPGR